VPAAHVSWTNHHITKAKIDFFFPKHLYPTFARTRPPATIVSKSLAALLLTYNWTQVALFHSMVNTTEYGDVAQAITLTFKSNGIKLL
jgi:hypothetical protein